MKAIVCNEPGSLTLAERPEPQLRDGEVLIRVRRVGVCGTDFHIYGGKHPYLESQGTSFPAKSRRQRPAASSSPASR